MSWIKQTNKQKTTYLENATVFQASQEIYHQEKEGNPTCSVRIQSIFWTCLL